MSTSPEAESQLSEDELIRAFTRLESKLRNFAYRILGNEADADEAYQMALIGCWLNLKKYREDGKLREWIFRILHNKVRDIQRKRRAKSIDPALCGLLSDKAGNIVENLEQQDLLQIVRTALAQLDNDSRELLLLKVEGLRRPDIAILLDVTEATVTMRLSRARDKLHSCCCDIAPSFAQHFARIDHSRVNRNPKSVPTLDQEILTDNQEI